MINLSLTTEVVHLCMEKERQLRELERNIFNGSHIQYTHAQLRI